ncbi:MAG: hypothetical protein K0R48_1191 [Gammaproteobacteria bacterium]|jgi:predicted small lipoprotein YifL|nr:hypothetical protein [Gammaproteobacteria bacterium]
MRNDVKILSVLIISALLSACGQSGPLYMPGQATGVHKKDVFLLNSDKTQTPAVKESTQDKAKPAATTAPASLVAAPTQTEQGNKPTD